MAAQIQDLEARGMALEKAFAPYADNCRNIDRICRLPETINWPSKEKCDKKGQHPALAQLITFNSGCSHPLSAFSAENTKKITQKAVVSFQAAEPVKGFCDLKEYNLPDRLERIVYEGRLSDEPKKKDDSDSAWLFECIIGLIRSNVPDEVIKTVITDERYAISAHVRKNARRLEKYAQRQIDRAHATINAKRQEKWDRVDQFGSPLASYNNARVAIKELGIVCVRDTFHCRNIIGGHIPQIYHGDLSDHVCSMIRQMILDHYNFDPKKEHVQDAMMQLCSENFYHPIMDYLDGLRWDGTERLKRLMPDYFGAEDNAINAEIGRLMLTSAVRRIHEPGCKYDIIIVLEGSQGSGKSTALVILAGKENFSDQDILAQDSKVQMEAVEGVWIYEASELEGMSKSDITKMKAFISRQEDRGRPAYGRFRENRPRQCIFVGTTNEETYLRDKTGNRRFLPVRTGIIDLEGLKRDRDQLWAEAAYLEAQGTSIVLDESMWEEAAKLQRDRLEPEPWGDILAEVQGELHGDYYRITTHELLSHYLDISAERQNPATSKRLAHVMRQLGWDGPKPMRAGKIMVRGFTRPAWPNAEL